MKKILIILLSLFILSGCSNKDNIKEDDSISDEVRDDETQETIEISFDIWDIDPVYEFDDIDVDFSLSNNSYSGTYVNGYYVNTSNVYDYVDEGGLTIISNGYIGFMNKNGEIITIPNYYNSIHKVGYDTVFLYKESSRTMESNKMGTLNSDYTLEEQPEGGIGGTVPYCYVLNDNNEIERYDYETYTSSPFNLYSYALENGYIKEGECTAVKLYHLRNGDPNWEDTVFAIVTKDSTNILNIPTDKYNIYDLTDSILMLYKNKDNSRYNGYIYPVDRDKTYVNVIYLDSNGNQIGETYDTGYSFFNGYAAVCKDGKWGYIDKQGNVVVDFIFDKATSISNGKAWVIYNGKTGRLNIMDMINNNISFTDEYLNVDTWKSDGKKRLEVTADALKKRQSPSTSSDRVGRVAKGSILVYTDTTTADGYTWYKLEDGSYIADQNGEWISELNSK